MDSFIIDNADWLQHLPIVSWIIGIVLAVMLALLGLQIFFRLRNRGPKSQRKKSAFAIACTEPEFAGQNSSLPLRRNAAVVNERVDYTPSMPSPNRSHPSPQAIEPGRHGVVDFYFAYDNQYKL